MSQKMLENPFLSFMSLLLLLLFIFPISFGNAEDCESYKYPYYPSLLKSSSQEILSITDFKDPQSCRACHISTIKEWEGSSHSHAFEDPIFLAMWRMGSKETQGKWDRFCISCHSPIGLLIHDIQGPEDEASAKEMSRKGVYCDFCHTVIDTTYKCVKKGYPHNTSLQVQPGNTKTGPIDNCKSTFHESAFLELHMKSEFCASCHDFFLQDSGFKISSTYEEWKKSIYAEKGIECQDCHMMPVELAMNAADQLEKPKNPGKASTIGPKRESIHQHKFIGGSPIIKKGNVSIQHGRESEKRLKGAARLEVDAKVTHEKGILRVTVHNERAGHNLPTGMAWLRQLWLEVLIHDKNGTQIFHCGNLDPKGQLLIEAGYFGVRPVDKNGRPTYKLWDIETFKSDTTIPPKGNRVESFEFKIPENVVQPLEAKVILHYRGFPQSLLNELLPDSSIILPAVDIAIKELEI